MTSDTLELFAHVNGQIVPHFDGSTFQAEHDQKRLGAQLLRVKNLMSDGNWRTLEEISEVTGDQFQAISARLRDFRKEKFGGYCVERRRRGASFRGIFEYRVREIKEAATRNHREGQKS